LDAQAALNTQYQGYLPIRAKTSLSRLLMVEWAALGLGCHALFCTKNRKIKIAIKKHPITILDMRFHFIQTITQSGLVRDALEASVHTVMQTIHHIRNT
jgi:hypothetical protein